MIILSLKRNPFDNYIYVLQVVLPNTTILLQTMRLFEYKEKGSRTDLYSAADEIFTSFQQYRPKKVGFSWNGVGDIWSRPKFAISSNVLKLSKRFCHIVNNTMWLGFKRVTSKDSLNVGSGRQYMRNKNKVSWIFLHIFQLFT